MSNNPAREDTVASARGLSWFLNSYGFMGTLILAANVLRTRVSIPGARLVRFPMYVRGKRNIDFGKRLTSGRSCRIEAYDLESTKKKLIMFGRDVQLNDFVHIAAVRSVMIGDRVLIASKVFISDHQHGTYSGDGPHSLPQMPPQLRPLSSNPVVIEEDVWIGETVTILPGVTIGKGSIIGAQSVVTKSIPAYSIAAGVPAKVLKKFDVATSRWKSV